MKRALLVHSFVAGASFLLIGCGDSHHCCTTEDTHHIASEGNMQMARTKTDSGLEYEILKEGEGASPQIGQHVTVHYTGWLNKNGEPGAKFDSSVDRGQKFAFYIGKGQVIRGWDEGVLSMKIGEKRRLFIPARLGYGARGAGAAIPPNADLIFDVELFEVS